ncbi:MAG: repressor LexA [Verrucomicrobia bacterium]|nr:repressor LexA [Verrucomicrobiota bacterium]
MKEIEAKDQEMESEAPDQEAVVAKKMDIQEKVGHLRDFYARERRVPGYNEMLEIFDYKSKNAVFQLIKRLDELGYLIKTGRKIAFTGKLTGNIRLLGAVQAGFPSPAEEELIDTLSLDEFLVEKPDATFMLKVTGDSMIEAGIHPDDMVLIEKGPSPKSGDIVIACVDGEWTMKYFIRDRSGIHLDPANPKYAPIRPENTLEIAGIVKTVIRKY